MIDRIQIQKEATPVPGRCQTSKEASKIFDVLAPNAVVCERTDDDGVDIVAQRAAAFHDINAMLERGRARLEKSAERGAKHGGRVSVSTGSAMLDRFKPWSK